MGRVEGMMVRRRINKKSLAAIVALATAALALTAMTFTNVTYWIINATLPPAMKYAGGDVNVAGGKYVKVSYYFESGLNITRISVMGFTGDPVDYTDVIKVCNRETFPITARLHFIGPVSGDYQGYIHTFYVYWNDPAVQQPRAGFSGAVTYSQSDIITIPAGGCKTVGAYIIIDPTLPATARDGKTVLATYQVNIVMST